MGVKKLKELSVEDLISLIKNHRSKLAALTAVGIDKKNSTAVKYLTKFIEEHSIDTSHYTMGVPLTSRYSKDEISEFAEKSDCWSELMRNMGIRFVGSNILTVKKLVKYYDIDTSHFNAVEAAKKNRTTKLILDSDIFCENSSCNRSTVKNRIIKNNLLDYKCEVCDNTGVWNGEVLVLHLEHKNGVNNDHRLENLCFLCPNCHSQTSTYAGRNTKKTVDK